MSSSIPRSAKTVYRAYVVRLSMRLRCLSTGKLICVLLSGVIAVWLLYGFSGHRLIEAMYRSTSTQILGRTIMAGKSSIPLEDYLEAADAMIVASTFQLIAGFLLAVFLIKKPLGLLYGSCFVAMLSFLAFCLIELFPSVGSFFHFDQIGFYYFHALYTTDDKLIHKLRPNLHTKMRAFYNEYPAVYGIPVQSTTIEWITDEDGFRNRDRNGPSDVLLIGDGFIEEGKSLVDTFGEKLEKQLSGLTVRNLGTGGYGPFQYLEVLKRYGLKRNPKYALIAFNEVNEISDVERYLDWKNAREKGLSAIYDSRTPIISTAFLGRYVGILVETFGHLRKVAFATAYAVLDRLNMYRQSRTVHPDIVLVEIGKKSIHKMLFVDKLITKSSDEILASETGRWLKEILLEFRNLCVQHKIIPVIMFIPSATHVYGEYSTERSGRNWVKIRVEQIAAKTNVEHAISTLARALRIEFIDLTDVFQSAAKNGKMLYYPLITHWNPEGMEVAAAFVADVLKAKIAAAVE